ncbi:hypothetical protein ACFY05_42160 [Microtetraspora fusca]|uniref:Helix-turn-helix transcriptional regulator n=1 Tax=Microtetraspora fusca TaxID=1997 RepID=A0ABW6VJ98_MICFU
MPRTPEDWERLGELLVARRVELNSEWSNRKRFTADADVDYRVVYDIEKAKRTNFSTAMIRRLEKAYGLRAGAIPALLVGADLESWTLSGSDSSPPKSDMDQLQTRTIRDGEFEVFLAEAKDAIGQLSPQQRDEAERTTIRLLRGILRDMGAQL